MSKWHVIDKDPNIMDLYVGLLTFGLGRHRYIVEHSETGERRVVFAYDAEDLGRKIASGEFDTGTWHEERPARSKKQREPRPKREKKTQSSGGPDDSYGCSGCFAVSLGILLLCLFVSYVVPWYRGQSPSEWDTRAIPGAVFITVISGFALLIEVLRRKH